MKHTAKITPSTLWMALLFILISLLIIACSRDDPETPLDESEVEQVTIKAADIAGPDGTIIYQGEEKTGSVRVPENALVGVMKDGEPYLYHPSLGEVDLTAETSRRAVGLFIEGLLNDESFAAVAARRAGSNDTPELGPDDDLLMSSGLALHRFKRKDLIRFTVENLVNRWVGLKLPDGTTRLIPPRARKFDSNMARWLVSEGHADIAKSLLQHSEDPYQSIASLYKAEVDSEKTGDVEIFGATFRAGNHMGPYDLPPGTEEARAADRDFYNLVNMFDLYYVVLEGMKYIGSTVITLECLDIAFGAMANLGGYGFFSFLSEDEGVSEYFSKVLKEDFYNSLYNCAYVAGSFGVWEIVQTFFDIVGALNWIEEDIANPDPIVMKAACYEKFELVSDNPCSLHTYLDFEYGEIEQTGGGDTTWCKADLTVENTDKDRKMLLLYSFEGDDEWHCLTNLLSICVGIDPGSDKLLPSGFNNRISDGVCTTNSRTEFVAIPDTPQCKEIYDEIRDTHFIPEGISVVTIENECACP